MKNVSGLLVALIFWGGCQSVPRSQGESSQDTMEAMTTVTEAIVGKDLSQEDMKKLNQQMRTDRDARAAVQVLTDTMSGAAAIKYCPMDGERFAASLTQCPTHKVELKEVEP